MEIGESASDVVVYTITDIGRELLHDMLADLPAELAGDSAEFLARLANFRWLGVAERLRVLDARSRALAAEGQRLAEFATARQEEWSRLALGEVCRRIGAEQDWLATVRARVMEAENLTKEEVR